MGYDLERFRKAQEYDYQIALEEIKQGMKMSHWMWYIFPQLKGLGRSYMAEFYGIIDLAEAKAYLADPDLGAHLIEISTALLELKTNDPRRVMGRPDDMKLQSSMTLFALADPEQPVFRQVLGKYFAGKMDRSTLKRLGYK